MPPDEQLTAAPDSAAPIPAADAAPIPAAADAAPAPAAPDAPQDAGASAPEAGGDAKPGLTPHTDTATLLEDISKPAEGDKPAEKPAEPEKPVESPKPEPEAKAGPGKSAESEKPAEPVPEAPPVYEFKLPEDMTAVPEALEAYRGVLTDNRVPPEAAQRMLDMHVAEMRRMAETSLEAQHRAFADTRAGWRKSIQDDPELGGAGFNTTMQAVARMRDMFVPEDRRDAFNEFLRTTGAGDHPEFIRTLHAAARFFDEPAMPSSAAAKPPPDNGRGRRGMRSLYDHPSSNRG